MRKAIGAVAAMLVVAGAVAAPANAVAPASVETVASPVTVAVEADAMAVLSYDSPTVATVAAPEPEPEPVAYVAPEPVVAPVASKPVNTGGTVAEQPEQPVATAPVAPAEASPEPAPVVAPAAPAAATEPVPTPTASEGSEVQVTPEEVYSPEYLEGVSFQQEGELYMGSYYGDPQPWINSGNRVVVSPTIRKADPNNPLGPTVDIFHVYASTAGALSPEQIAAMGDPGASK